MAAKVYTWPRFANPLRGTPFAEHAVDFIDSFKIDTMLSYKEFDLWALRRDLYPLGIPEPDQVDPRLWSGHLKLRNDVYVKLNNAANHPRMTEVFSRDCFQVRRYGNETLKVITPKMDVEQGKFFAKIETRTERVVRKMMHNFQAMLASEDESQRQIAEKLAPQVIEFEEKTKKLIAKVSLRIDVQRRDK